LTLSNLFTEPSLIETYLLEITRISLSLNLNFDELRLLKRLNLLVFNDTDIGRISNKYNIHHIFLCFTSYRKY
jgi:hypothetical protein